MNRASQLPVFDTGTPVATTCPLILMSRVVHPVALPITINCVGGLLESVPVIELTVSEQSGDDELLDEPDELDDVQGRSILVMSSQLPPAAHFTMTS